MSGPTKKPKKDKKADKSANVSDAEKADKSGALKKQKQPDLKVVVKKSALGAASNKMELVSRSVKVDDVETDAQSAQNTTLSTPKAPTPKAVPQKSQKQCQRSSCSKMSAAVHNRARFSFEITCHVLSVLPCVRPVVSHRVATFAALLVKTRTQRSCLMIC